MKRRDFLRLAGGAAAGLAITPVLPVLAVPSGVKAAEPGLLQGRITICTGLQGSTLVQGFNYTVCQKAGK